MDKSDKILVAVEQLAKNLTRQIDAVRTDLTGQIDAVRTDLTRQIDAVRTDLTGQIDAVRTDLTGQIAAVDAKVDAVRTDLTVLQTDVAILKVGQAQILDHLDVAELKGRVEEQSRTIASLIPTRVAAVPGR